MKYQRYAEYKDSGVEQLGEVPAHWNVAPIKRVASSNDDVLAENTPDDYEIEYLEISGVDETKGIVATETLLFKNAPSRARRLVRNGDIVVSTVRTYLKAIAAIVCPPSNFVVSTGFAVIRPKDELTPRFASHLFKAAYLVDEVIANSLGVSYPAINASELVRIPVPVPPLEEQQAVATFLDRETAQIDSLIAKQERLITVLQEKRQTLISHAVTKGLNPDAPMKDSGVEWLGEVPAHWDLAALGYVSTIVTGSTPDRGKPEYWDGSIPWLKTGEINYDLITGAEEYITQEGLDNSSAKLAVKGTLLMAMYGQGVTRGRVAILGIEAAFNQACAAISLNGRMSSDFARYYFICAYDYIRDNGNETSQMNLSAGIISKIKILIPPTVEQQAVVAYLDTHVARLEQLIDKVEQAVVLLVERRSSLISAAVTGKIDVRNGLN